MYLYKSLLKTSRQKVHFCKILSQFISFGFVYFSTEPDDYQANNSELVFSSDSGRHCVSISLESDGILEDTEEFQVSLASEETSVVLDPDKAIVSILDTDGKMVFYIPVIL